MATHRFTPDRWHTTIGPHAPVLSIADGDTVETTTVDAGGANDLGQHVAGSPNPMTGPFYVQGAEPGDALAVRFDRLRPNRPSGYSSNRLAPHVVDADTVRAFHERERAWWELALDAGTATLTSPDTSLGRLTVPLRPMLGCFGVAPGGGQAIGTDTSGPYGGNMDYKGFEEGVTVFLPVSLPGGLFFLGDGHALQGDGEIAGTGIETSFDVRFTVRLRKGWRIGWPRGENATHVFTVGNARPLDQALQHATTEMLSWLQQDYGLDAVGGHILLGQCVEYEVGNVFDPAYTMVCKLSKNVLGPR